MIVDTERKNNFYKLQMSVWEDEDEKILKWKDLYFDVREIVGWAIATKSKGEFEIDKAIDIYTRGGDVFVVKEEQHIKDYLLKQCYPI